MDQNDTRYAAYVRILKGELVPAMGCTEPIAIAFTAAKARHVLAETVERMCIEASGNIIKNVKSVVVPHTDGRKGIEAAAAIGVIAGNDEKSLEVIADVSAEKIAELDDFLRSVPIAVKHAETGNPLDISVFVYHGEDYAMVRVAHSHANVVHVEKNGEILLHKDIEHVAGYGSDYALLSMDGIYDFALSADLKDVEEVIGRQIAYNTAISDEGLAHSYGANIARVLLDTYGDRVEIRARARAAAGSDARMGGCELPVIINSGSGNQGMTASLPVIEYAKELGVSKEKLYRALLISNLVTIYQKIHIGRLSAYCGAVSAGAGAGAGITYLLGGDEKHIAHTVVNALAITSGIICDGAKPSCAAKISSAVDAGILGCKMYIEGKEFKRGDGIVGCSIEETIEHVGDLARIGMKETDEEIIDMMIHNG